MDMHNPSNIKRKNNEEMKQYNKIQNEEFDIKYNQSKKFNTEMDKEIMQNNMQRIHNNHQNAKLEKATKQAE
jgi:uncharacterized Fe-S radical SAM superfamily protein PflX